MLNLKIKQDIKCLTFVASIVITVILSNKVTKCYSDLNTDKVSIKKWFVFWLICK